MAKIVTIPRCIACGRPGAHSCPVCGEFVHRECSSYFETWGPDNLDVEPSCEHSEPESNSTGSGPGWNDGGPVLPQSGLPGLR